MRPLRLVDQTVLVTGASSGIGERFALDLAAQGVAGLVLVARRESRLEAVSARILERSPLTRVHCLPADLADPDAVPTLMAELERRGIVVTGLVNAAGFGTKDAFANIDPARVDAEVAVNVASLTALTRALLPGMLRRRDGFVMNVASIAAYQPIPGMAVYAATKAFVLTLTEGLATEAAPSNVRVLAVSPGPTSTEFFDIAGEGASAWLPRMSAERVVRASLRALQRRRPPLVVVPGGMNRLTTIGARLAPRRALASAIGRAMGQDKSEGEARGRGKSGQ